MAPTALALYLVWAGLAFGWRTVVQHRRTGDSGLRLHAEVGTVQWWSKLGFIAAIAAGLAAPIVSLWGLADVAAFDRDAVHLVGLVVTIVGVVLTLVAQLAMGASWRIGVDPAERTGLVTAGPFSLVRNPIFTAMLVTAFGLTAMVPNVVALVGIVTLFVALEAQVRLVEEPYLRRMHGDAYAGYTARVGRFVPGLGRFS